MSPANHRHRLDKVHLKNTITAFLQRVPKMQFWQLFGQPALALPRSALVTLFTLNKPTQIVKHIAQRGILRTDSS